ncbi:MAG TPA: hypothetical protein ENN19_07585 [Chloroflexi bacterium]|nr:hypothetical protein [Chloroflexota bacterium]
MKLKKHSMLVLLALLLLLLIEPGMAMAQEPPPPIEAQIVEKTGMNTLFAYGNPIGEGKEALESTMQEIERLERARREEERTITPKGWYNYHYYYSASAQAPWSGSAVLTKYDNTHVHLSVSPFYGTVTIDGHTKTIWPGASPYYSDEIRLSEGWYFKGHGISVTAGSGGIGGSWSAAGQTVSFDSGWVNTAGWAFSLSNFYINVFADSHISIYAVSDSATGSHRFGNQIVTVTANGGKRWWVW